MSLGRQDDIDSGLLKTMLRDMERLRAAEDGSVLWQIIYSTLDRHADRGQINGLCAQELHSRLVEFSQDHNKAIGERVKARLIQHHLVPYLSSTNTPASEDPKTSLDTGFLTHDPEVTSPQTKKDAGARFEAAAGSRAAAGEEGDRPLESTAKTRIEDASVTEFAEVPPSEAVSPTEARRAATPVSEHVPHKAHALAKLNQQREVLAKELDSATKLVKALQLEKKQLRLELNNVRKQTSRRNIRLNVKNKKKWSALPRRNVFLKQLGAEVERAKRSSSSFMFAVINIQDLDRISKEYGEQTRDAMLGGYASEILSGFRAYDIVARYGEFSIAVLFPDTGEVGAMRALEKAQKRAADSYVDYNGYSLTLPGFKGVVTSYAIGEEMSALLQRIDDALAEIEGDRDSGLVVRRV